MTTRGSGRATTVVGVKRDDRISYFYKYILMKNLYSKYLLLVDIIMAAVGAVVVIPMDGRPAITHLLTICGLSDVQRAAVMNIEGITTLAALQNIYLSDVKQMTENLSRLAVNRGGAYIGTGLTANIRALIWWAQDIRAQGETINPNDWNAGALDDARQRMLLERQGRDKEEDLVDAPKKLDPIKWVDSYLAFLNFLRGQVSSDGKRTLDYVVRKVPPVGWTPTSREDRLKYNAPLIGPFYVQDNRKVYRVVKQ